MQDTIVAIASPTTPAPRGIVRLSGDQAADVLQAAGIPLPRQASRFGASLDLGSPLGEISVDVLFWPDQRCYTGQPSAEIHCLGSLPILTAVVDRMIRCGARPARPGEFTLRAFLAGRLDLVQAEAVLGVIEAEGTGSLDAALTQLAGNVSTPLHQARHELLDLLADVEAGLDFVDEDIEFVTDKVLLDRLLIIRKTVQSVGEQLRQRGGGSGLPVVVVRGMPNAGKSCLINRLSGTETSIVTEVAGTTRDSVTTTARIDAIEVMLVDTAGIEAQNDELRLAMARQNDHQDRRADVRLWCVDAHDPGSPDVIRRIEATAAASQRAGTIDIRVATKSDLVDRLPECFDDRWIACSGKTGQGEADLITHLAQRLGQRDLEETGSVIGTAARCSGALAEAATSLDAAIETTTLGSGHEWVATELRTAANALGEVTGAVYTDDILDRVFSRFCIGK